MTVEKLRTLELWTHLQASLDFSLESTGVKLHLLVRVLLPLLCSWAQLFSSLFGPQFPCSREYRKLDHLRVPCFESFQLSGSCNHLALVLSCVILGVVAIYMSVKRRSSCQTGISLSHFCVSQF